MKTAPPLILGLHAERHVEVHCLVDENATYHSQAVVSAIDACRKNGVAQMLVSFPGDSVVVSRAIERAKREIALMSDNARVLVSGDDDYTKRIDLVLGEVD